MFDSSLPDFYNWVKVFEARSCFAGCELPIDAFLLFVPRAFPCRGLLRELLDRPDPAVPETLRGERRELDLSDVEPRSVLRGEVDLEPFRVAPRRAGREPLVKGRDAVSVEVVHHQDDLLGVRVRAIEEGGDEIRPVLNVTDFYARKVRLFSKDA